MSLKEQKIIGLQQQSEKVVAHINELRRALAIESDASVRFSLSEKIAVLEADLEQIQATIENEKQSVDTNAAIGKVISPPHARRALYWIVGGALAISLALWGWLSGTFFTAKEGSFTDPRDGRIYKTMRIGHQLWLAENLNYETPDSWCYDDDPTKCERYGRLYIWSEAMKACPRGWRLPSRKEWSALAEHLSGETPTDEDKAFVVIPNTPTTQAFIGGYGGRRSSEGKYEALGRTAEFWTSTEIPPGDAVSAYLTAPDYSIYESLRLSLFKNTGLSCRCVQDKN